MFIKVKGRRRAGIGGNVSKATKRKGGRPRLFATPTVARTLHLPLEFWTILEDAELLQGDETSLSKGAALARAIRRSGFLERLTAATEAPDGSHE